jgi:hypothetical protein
MSVLVGEASTTVYDVSSPSGDAFVTVTLDVAGTRTGSTGTGIATVTCTFDGATGASPLVYLDGSTGAVGSQIVLVGMVAQAATDSIVCVSAPGDLAPLAVSVTVERVMGVSINDTTNGYIVGGPT